MEFFSGKTVLVTGATGLIGTNLINQLMKFEDIRVIALSRNEEKIKKCFGEYTNNRNFRYVVQDISEGLDNIGETIDLCFHGAGSMEGSVIANKPVDIIIPNLIGTQVCCEFMKKQFEDKGVRGRVLLFSSVTVYANHTELDIVVQETDTQYTEALESRGACYSQSKRMVEVIAQSYARQFDIDIVIARLSTVYGSTRAIPNTAFFEFVKKGILGEDILINNSGMPRRDNIYIDDAVRGLICICEKGLSGEVYNVSSNREAGNYLAIDEIASLIAEACNEHFTRDEFHKVKVTFKEQISKRKPGIALDNGKLKKLGWNIGTDFRTGISKVIEEIRVEDYFQKRDV